MNFPVSAAITTAPSELYSSIRSRLTRTYTMVAGDIVKIKKGFRKCNVDFYADM